MNVTTISEAPAAVESASLSRFGRVTTSSNVAAKIRPARIGCIITRRKPRGAVPPGSAPPAYEGPEIGSGSPDGQAIGHLGEQALDLLEFLLDLVQLLRRHVVVGVEARGGVAFTRCHFAVLLGLIQRCCSTTLP